jgi:small subunit ribosomal protein S4
MARDTGPQCKRCRREGVQLFLKGTRCHSIKCGVRKRDYPPGEHAWRRAKFSEYGLQLREKQKVKRYYGVTERQFRTIFSRAARTKGNTGQTLMALLEARLDNVVYRLGFAVDRRQARQMIAHGHFTVNDKKVTIPSYVARRDDVVAPVLKGGMKEFIQQNMEATKENGIPSWLSLDAQALRATVNDVPKREEIPIQVQEQLIIELCSK